MNSNPPCPSLGTIIHTIHLYIQLPFDSVSCISAWHVDACFNLCDFCNMLDDSGAMHQPLHPVWCIVHCININRICHQITHVLIQSMGDSFCICEGIKRQNTKIICNILPSVCRKSNRPRHLAGWGIVPVRHFCFKTRARFQQNACRFSKNAPTMDDLGKTTRVKRKRP